MESYVHSYIDAGLKVKNSFLKKISPKIIDFSKTIHQSILNGGKLLICGNGGSAADAQHVAAEFVNRFKRERNPLPAISLSTDTSVITSIANDYSFDEIFSKQVKALARQGDCFMAISTSGNSSNIINALRAAREAGCVNLSLTGKDGGKMPPLSDKTIIVPSQDTPIIQEVHLVIEHLICDLVEQMAVESK